MRLIIRLITISVINFRLMRRVLPSHTLILISEWANRLIPSKGLLAHCAALVTGLVSVMRFLRVPAREGGTSGATSKMPAR